MNPVINYLAVFAAAVVAIVLGFLWYGPLFGKPWMKLMGFTKESMSKGKQSDMMKSYAIMIVSTLVMAYVLAHSTEFGMAYTRIYGVMGGLMSGFFVWLGYMATIQLDDVIWGSKSWKLYFLNTSYRLVSLLAMGVILATWR